MMCTSAVVKKDITNCDIVHGSNFRDSSTVVNNKMLLSLTPAAAKDKACSTYVKEHLLEPQSQGGIQLVRSRWLPLKQAGGKTRKSNKEDNRELDGGGLLLPAHSQYKSCILSSRLIFNNATLNTKAILPNKTLVNCMHLLSVTEHLQKMDSYCILSRIGISKRRQCVVHYDSN